MSNPSFTRDEILELWEHLTPDEQAEIMSLFDQMPIWTPIAGVQTQAYLSKATITGYFLSRLCGGEFNGSWFMVLGLFSKPPVWR